MIVLRWCTLGHFIICVCQQHVMLYSISFKRFWWLIYVSCTGTFEALNWPIVDLRCVILCNLLGLLCTLELMVCFSGQLKDIYGSYNGAFYFGSGAMFLGGVVMAIGNIYNTYSKRAKLKYWSRLSQCDNKLKKLK